MKRTLRASTARAGRTDRCSTAVSSSGSMGLTDSPWGGAAALLQLAAPPRACGPRDGGPLRWPQTPPPPGPGAVRRGDPPGSSSPSTDLIELEEPVLAEHRHQLRGDEVDEATHDRHDV